MSAGNSLDLSKRPMVVKRYQIDLTTPPYAKPCGNEEYLSTVKLNQPYRDGRCQRAPKIFQCYMLGVQCVVYFGELQLNLHRKQKIFLEHTSFKMAVNWTICAKDLRATEGHCIIRALSRE